MWPTFLPGDGMVVMPYGEGESIRKGDVVVFFDCRYDRNVVHRVIAINTGEIRTQGDNNPYTDTILLSPADILGKVVRIYRCNRTFLVQNGLSGDLIGWGWRVRRMLIAHLRRYGAPVYRRLAESGALRLPPAWLRLQVVRFHRTHGIELILRIWGRWNIGAYRTTWQHWKIRRPFRMFIDESTLKHLEKDYS